MAISCAIRTPPGWSTGCGRIGPGHLVFDPGPLIATIDPDALETVLRATRWPSLDATEATTLTGKQDPVEAAVAASARIP